MFYIIWQVRTRVRGSLCGTLFWNVCSNDAPSGEDGTFMFASEEFDMEVNACESRLKDNGRKPINLDALRQRNHNHSGLVLGRVVGVGGLGGGSTSKEVAAYLPM